MEAKIDLPGRKGARAPRCSWCWLAVVVGAGVVAWSGFHAGGMAPEVRELIEADRQAPLDDKQATLYRSMVMRMAYLSVDRPDLIHVELWFQQ